ncbi:MAG: hypothetical protein A2033_07950 [Bacteroidetes bacterium GWA2_31_9]|nr:MAG: hypothetical protein A2033_07950 [Bacteroidetes bacterium GWA2_31_9]
MNYYRPGGFSLLPTIIKNLLIINALFFLATISLKQAIGFDLEEYLALYYFDSPNFKPYQFISYMFMHGGISHIFFNMFALWMFGKVLEEVWGPKKFLIYYLVTGVGAAVVHTFVNWWTMSSMMTDFAAIQNTPSPDLILKFVQDHLSNANPKIYDFINQWSLTPNDPAYINDAMSICTRIIDMKMNIPTVGASGAVYGVLLAFGMMFPNSLIYVFFAIPIKAKFFVIIYGAMELWTGIMNDPTDNVAHFAHLGGMLFGFILIKLWKKNDINRFEM